MQFPCGATLYSNSSGTLCRRVRQRNAEGWPLVVDVPPHGSKDIEVEFPLITRYGIVVLQALQIGAEHGPFESWSPDPTPEDSVAFRIVNPRQAPRGYAEWTRKLCVPCRGF